MFTPEAENALGLITAIIHGSTREWLLAQGLIQASNQQIDMAQAIKIAHAVCKVLVPVCQAINQVPGIMADKHITGEPCALSGAIDATPARTIAQ